ncbi:GTP cyclohydrolase I FolE [Parachlamydia sp. AcF125]|uniref:GTP cyclohydrolase I FolE n=1 Tax=Parachlamydia sp. AcF125 TaxID=2795736 RepID=UPI001BC92F58|nr:GTP cyclohydrolase I FolE [Parachlamydia sp. AcF125]MBS4167932.1 GTP cyclohydrolase 1 [Parachlamydia sp. AcF125]
MLELDEKVFSNPFINAHMNDTWDEIPYPWNDNQLTDEEKIKKIEYYFEKILLTLGMDLEDDSINKTPHRYAKMLVKELFPGLNPHNFPKITTQENKFNYRNMLLESHIRINSMCEHHFVPILGYCHIAYIPNDRVIGLSKLNRIAHYFARRPQVQERLTRQIKECLCSILNTPDVAVVLEATHFCVKIRGVEDQDSLTRTSDFGGLFEEESYRKQFLEAIPKNKS